MKQYLDLARLIMEKGTVKGDRTGTGTKSIFGHQMHFDLAEGFPLVTTKQVHFKSVLYELLWFLRGDTNIKFLKENGVRIWDEWADENGDLGPVYGRQWRSWPAIELRSSGPFDAKVVHPGSLTTKTSTTYFQAKVNVQSIDQIEQAVELIKKDPDSRRIIVNAWNCSELPSMALAPCHVLFQFYVADGRLSCQLYQRSFH